MHQAAGGRFKGGKDAPQPNSGAGCTHFHYSVSHSIVVAASPLALHAEHHLGQAQAGREGDGCGPWAGAVGGMRRQEGARRRVGE
eukprot:scaffold19516_cov174-Isochrysis_galbana.AAC.1